jgi:CspA family cold shock protein
MRHTGRVRFFSDKSGYGFIIPDEGSIDVFVHRTAIRPLLKLLPNQNVTYDLVKTEKGNGFAASAVVVSES